MTRAAPPLEEILAAVSGAIAEAHDVPVREVVLVPPGGVPRTSSASCNAASAGSDTWRERSRRWQWRAPAAQASPSDAAAVERVASLMAGVLGVGGVGPEEDFFALGGHSLMATQLASRLRDDLGVEVPLRAIFESPTPVALAGRLAAFAPASGSSRIPPVDRTQPLRLSFSQERMWHLHQLDPGGSAYNVAGAVVLDGPLDDAVPAGACPRRGEARVATDPVHGRGWSPVGILGSTPTLSLEVEDLSARADPEASATALATDLASAPSTWSAATPCGLASSGSLRPATWWQSAPTTSRWTGGRWASCSTSSSPDTVLWWKGDRWPSPSPGPRYADYAAWQRDRLSPEAAERRGGALAAPPGGSAAPRARNRSPPQARVPRRREAASSLSTSPVDSWSDCATLARTEGATLYMIMLAAFEVLLHRATGQTDIVVGTPIANRHRSASEGLVGTLVNTVPCARSRSGRAFRDLLRGVREAALDAFAHQELPFERLVSALPFSGAPAGCRSSLSFSTS